MTHPSIIELKVVRRANFINIGTGFIPGSFAAHCAKCKFEVIVSGVVRSMSATPNPATPRFTFLCDVCLPTPIPPNVVPDKG